MGTVKARISSLEEASKPFLNKPLAHRLMCATSLGYDVMVAQEVLVLLVGVRVPVSQSYKKLDIFYQL